MERNGYNKKTGTTVCLYACSHYSVPICL